MTNQPKTLADELMEDLAALTGTTETPSTPAAAEQASQPVAQPQDTPTAPAANTEAETTEPTTSQTQEQADPAASQGQEDQDDSFGLGDLDFSQQEQVKPADKEPVKQVAPTEAELMPKVEQKIYEQLSQKLGKPVKSIDDLLTAKLPVVYEGYSADTSALIQEHIDSGLLLPDDIAQQKITSPWVNQSVDDLAFDAVRQEILEDPANKDLSEKEISQRVIEEIEGMSDREKLLTAKTFGSEMQRKAESALAQISQKITRDEQARAAIVQRETAEKQAFFSKVEAEVSAMKTFPGTDVVLDDKMRKTAEAFSKMILDLPKDNPLRTALGNPDAKGSFQALIARSLLLAFPQRIAGIVASHAKSEGTRAAINQATRTATPASASGTLPIASANQGTSFSDAEAALTRALGY